MISVLLLVLAIVAIFAGERIVLTLVTRSTGGRQWIRAHKICHPNTISTIRMPAGLIAVLLWHWGLPVPATIWFAFWMISDLSDGTIARNCDLESEKGKWLDPLSDKCLYVPPLLFFAWSGTLPLLWVAGLVLIDAVGQAARLFIKKRAANLFGKAKTALITILLFLTAIDRLGDVPYVSPEFLSMLTMSATVLAFLSFYCKVIPDLWYANSLTLANFLCGLAAIWRLAQDQLTVAFILVFVGQFFDLFDGRLARRFGSTRHGAFFDDVADATSFGVAIAFLVFKTAQNPYLGALLGVVHLACVVFRLVRFIRTKDDMPAGIFQGMPAPGGALLTGAAVLIFRGNDPVVVAAALLSCVLMVSKVRYRHFARKIWPQLPNLLKTTGFVIVLVTVNKALARHDYFRTFELLCLGFAVTYTVLGIDTVYRRVVPRRRAADTDDTP